MSIFDHPDSVPGAPSWRCPHCRTLQVETSHCWRCSRSAVNCSTCHRFRPAVADDMGYCVGDRTRTPMTGDEVRACWEATPAEPAVAGLFEAPDHPAEPPIPRPHPRPRPQVKQPKPLSQEFQAAAWAELPQGDLLDAPHVEPGRTVTTEAQRHRRRFWRPRGTP